MKPDLKRILHYVRIHSGDNDVFARATHHVVQKDALMTYVSARFAQADPGIVSGSTIERKKMSTKTIYKRIALVAVAGLVSGLVSVAPATASDWSSTADLLDCQVGATTTDDSATGCTQVATGRVSIGLTDALLDAAVTDNDGISATISNVFVSVSGATIVGVTNNGTGAFPADITTGEFVWGYDGVNDADGLIEGRFLGADAVAATNEKVADSDDNNSIVLTSAVAATATVTVFQFSAAGLRTVLETHKVTWVAPTTLDLASIHTSLITDANAAGSCTVANKADANNQSTYYDVVGGAGAASLCVIGLNGAGAAETGADITVTTEGPGLLAGAAVAASAADADGILVLAITNNGLPGTAKFNVSISSLNQDGLTKTVKTSTISMIFGDTIAASVVLTPLVGALDDGAGDTAAVNFVVRDKNSNPIAKADDNAASLVIDSDVASTLVVDVAGEADFGATALAITTASSISAAGVETKGVISLDCAATVFEKITIKMHLEDNTVASNTVTLYCTQAVGDVTTETMTMAIAGSTVTATVLAGIATKPTYPVADAAAGSAVTFVTSGGTFKSAAPAIVGGIATTEFYSAGLAKQATIVGSMGSATATAIATLATTSPLDALNTLVTSLIAKVNALTALVSKIQRKVKA